MGLSEHSVGTAQNRLPTAIERFFRYNEGVPDDHAHLVSLLSERWVMTLATQDAEAPYSTPLFYALDADPMVPGSRGPWLVFISDPATHHGQHLGAGPTPVSAATYLETEEVASIRGVQLRGTVHRGDSLPSAVRERARAVYLARHPVAANALKGHAPPAIYVLVVTWAKLTDNRLGFKSHRIVQYANADAVHRTSSGNR